MSLQFQVCTQWAESSLGYRDREITLCGLRMRTPLAVDIRKLARYLVSIDVEADGIWRDITRGAVSEPSRVLTSK